MIESNGHPFYLDVSKYPFSMFTGASQLFITFLHLRFPNIRNFRDMFDVWVSPKEVYKSLQGEYFVWLCTGLLPFVVQPDFYKRVAKRVDGIKGTTTLTGPKLFRTLSMEFNKYVKYPRGNPEFELEVMSHRKEFQFTISEINRAFLPAPFRNFLLRSEGFITTSVLANDNNLKMSMVAEVLANDPVHKLNIQEEMLASIPFIDMSSGGEFLIFDPLSRRIMKGSPQLSLTNMDMIGFVCDESMNQLLPPYDFHFLSEHHCYFIPTQKCLMLRDFVSDEALTTSIVQHPTFPFTLGYLLSILDVVMPEISPFSWDPRINDLTSAVRRVLEKWNPLEPIFSAIKIACPYTWEGPAAREFNIPVDMHKAFSWLFKVLGFSTDVQFYPPESLKKPLFVTNYWLDTFRINIPFPRILLIERTAMSAYDTSLKTEIIAAADRQGRFLQSTTPSLDYYCNWKTMHLEIRVGKDITFKVSPGEKTNASDKK